MTSEWYMITRLVEMGFKAVKRNYGYAIINSHKKVLARITDGEYGLLHKGAIRE